MEPRVKIRRLNPRDIPPPRFYPLPPSPSPPLLSPQVSLNPDSDIEDGLLATDNDADRDKYYSSDEEFADPATPVTEDPDGCQEFDEYREEEETSSVPIIQEMNHSASDPDPEPDSSETRIYVEEEASRPAVQLKSEPLEEDDNNDNDESYFEPPVNNEVADNYNDVASNGQKPIRKPGQPHKPSVSSRLRIQLKKYRQKPPQFGNRKRKPNQVLYTRPTFKCDFCTKIFNTDLNRQKHEKDAHDRSRYSCPICNKLFNSSNSLQNHQILVACGESKPEPIRSKNRNKEIKYFCKVCGEGFADYAMMIRHSTVRHQPQSYGCPVCSKKFSRDDSRKRHIQNIHEGKQYPCGVEGCSRLFTTQYCRNLHSKRDH